MIKLTSIAKKELIEKIGILQPNIKDIDDGLANYSDILKRILEDEDTSVELAEKIREIMIGDIVDPLNAIRFLISEGLYNKETSEGKLEEDFKINDEEVGIKSIKIKTSGNLTGSNAVESARASLGIRESKKITLFTSGFWIAIGNISNIDIIDFERRLTEMSLEVRESMLGLEFTSDVSFYTEIIMDFVEDHLIASSLDVDNEEIRKYILMADVEMLYGGVIDAINPRGFTNFFKCSNALTVVDNTDEEDEIGVAVGEVLKCDETFTARLKATNLLKVASDKLNSEQRLILLGSKNSTDIETLAKYKESFNIDASPITIDDDDIKFFLILKDASLSDVVLAGKFWNDNIAEALNNLSLGDDDKLKINAYKKYYTAQALAIYAPYIDKLILSDGSEIDDMGSIIGVLAEISDNDVLSKGLSEYVSKYIDSRIISIYAVPEFTCSKCNESFSSEEAKEDFKGFIPINLRKYFFTLLTLRG